VLTINHAKALQGKLELPPSPDLFCIAAFASLAEKRAVRVHPVMERPAFTQWAALLDGHAALRRENDACIIDPCSGNTAADIIFTDDHLPYRDLVVFLALSTRKRVVFRAVSEKRLAGWQDQAKRIGYGIDVFSEGSSRGMVLARETPEAPFPSSISEQDLHASFGLLFGLRAKRSFQTDFTLSTPFRHLAESFGHLIEVKRDIGAAEKDPFLRRMKIKTRQRLSSSDQLYTVTVDFSAPLKPENGAADILLPGDEVLMALFLTAKSLIHKGSLVIDNAPLEPWAGPIVTLMHKMGCKVSQQVMHRTAFGSAGMITLPKFELTGQKTDFIPPHHAAFQLPAMAVLSAFSEGQSLYRRFDDLRRSDPDGIKELEVCLKAMNVKFGDIPDGFVIKGGSEYDGFDLIEPLPAHVAGAFAVAGLHCVGATTINDDLLLERWPDFHELIEKLFEFRTS
jgi:hypothetical protein